MILQIFLYGILGTFVARMVIYNNKRLEKRIGYRLEIKSRLEIIKELSKRDARVIKYLDEALLCMRRDMEKNKKGTDI